MKSISVVMALVSCLVFTGCNTNRPKEEEKKLPDPIEEPVIDQKELMCLAENIYYEARNQTYDGMVSIANVTMNRVNHKGWKSTICGVVNQKRKIGRRTVCQFSWVCQSNLKKPETYADRKAWKLSKQIALDILMGNLKDMTNGATHYHTKSVHPIWRHNLTEIGVIGSHIFYKKV